MTQTCLAGGAILQTCHQGAGGGGVGVCSPWHRFGRLEMSMQRAGISWAAGHRISERPRMTRPPLQLHFFMPACFPRCVTCTSVDSCHCSLTWLGLTPAPMMDLPNGAAVSYIPGCVLGLPALQFLDISGGRSRGTYMWTRGRETGGTPLCI